MAREAGPLILPERHRPAGAALRRELLELVVTRHLVGDLAAHARIRAGDQEIARRQAAKAGAPQWLVPRRRRRGPISASRREQHGGGDHTRRGGRSSHASNRGLTTLPPWVS